MIHVAIIHDPQNPSNWVAKDLDAKPPRVIYSGTNIFAAQRARTEYIARIYQT